MDPGFLLIENFARLAAIVGVMLAVPLFAWGGYLFMTSMGDPNRSASARNAIISVLIGVVIIGCAFIVPAVVGESVVAPSGGIVYEQDRGINCDGILRQQLVANEQASNGERINFVIRQIQGRFEDCDDVFWTPLAHVDGTGVDVDAARTACFDTNAHTHIAGVEAPAGLRRHAGDGAILSGRDARNNIIVHWHLSPADGVSGLPSDSSICWMYVSSIDTWVEGYR